ncbi:SAV_2336 N-terminal domain-related protein [Streptomyces bacillaris]
MDEALARGMARLLAQSWPSDPSFSPSSSSAPASSALSAEEIADALWMARIIGHDTARAADEEPTGEHLIPHGEGDIPADYTAEGRESEGTRTAGRRPSRPPAPPGGKGRRPRDDGGSTASPSGIPLHPVSTGTVARAPSGGATGTDRTASGGPGTVIRAPREPALGDSLAIARALRPLKRRVPAAGALTLDEAATATASGEASLLLPAWLPRTERWLSVDLVVDTGPSMAIWHRLAAELRTLLEGQGAFRTVRTWSLESGGTQPRLSVFRRATGVRPQRAMPWERLADATGRHLLLVLTDGVGPLWRRGGMREALRQWSHDRPVAVLQVLPRSLWHRTGLDPVPVVARPAPQGRTTPLFRAETSVRGTPPTVRRGGWVPVLELDPEWIAPWAQVVSGRAAGWTPLLAVDTDGPGEEVSPAPEAYGTAPGSMDAPALVERFRGEASQGAFELAGYLAATPLVLPVMRLVQRVMMPRSRPSHLAEVFLSGLLSRADGGSPVPGEDPDLTLYDFRPGVRDVLLATLTRQESLRTLDVVGQVSGRVAQLLGGSLDFRALIPSAGADGTWRLPEGSLPFARIAADVLAGLGGEHRAAAAALTERIEAASPRTEPPRAGSPAVSAQAGSARAGDRPRPVRSGPGRLASTPMLFVGLGGTGSLIGAELERRLRAELCGINGTALQAVGSMEPYQLPGILQFVYADFSEPDLQLLPRFGVDPALRAAYARTSHITHNLLPDADSSLEAARLLSAGMRDEVADWLPPRQNEPHVAPLRHGAGQLPTVGRVALFAALRDSLQPVLEPLVRAADAMAGSSGGRIEGCDVFVAFSVAGGTGAGIFLDYLHLIDHAFATRHISGVRIHPLVVLPSAFPTDAGGGRGAELNAARSLVDLFRLVDSQNASTGGDEIGDIDREPGLAIRYPDTTSVRLRTGTLPTAFLFSPTAGMYQDDLPGSIASLVMALAGGERSDGHRRDRAGTARGPQGFAAGFIDRDTHRGTLSPTGIGRQGVSTSLVATMTTPLEQLADLMAGQLLQKAVARLGSHLRAGAEREGEVHIRQLFTDSRIEELWECPQLDVEGPQPLPRGARAVEEALNRRIEDMERRLSELSFIATRQVASMVDRFTPRTAIDRLLRDIDPFLAERVVKGALVSDDAVARLGFLGMLANRNQYLDHPERGGRHTTRPPQTPRLRDRIAGISPVRWSDDLVQTTLQAQDRWYRRQSQNIWRAAWRTQRRLWQPQAEQAANDLSRLVGAFRRQADREGLNADEKTMFLYEDRTGVAYLLPPQRDLARLYEEIVTRLVRGEASHEDGDETVLFLRALNEGPSHAARPLERTDPTDVVANVRTFLMTQVMRVLTGEHLDAHPLLPPVSHLLTAARGHRHEAREEQDALDLFHHRLAGLLPAGFAPEGTGPLRVLVTHPRVEAVEEVREYLGRALRLPSEAGISVEYREVESESITVVLLRTGMSLTQVPEARRVLRRWATAEDDEQPHHLLRWRQRVGYADGWLLSTAEDRRTVLHHLLCCLWNGQVDVLEGDTASPSLVRLRLFPEQGTDSPGVKLRLRNHKGATSSWPDLLRAYERWTLVDDHPIVEDHCRWLMLAQPSKLTRSDGTPHPLFVELTERIAPQQLRVLDSRRDPSGRRDRRWAPLWEFWSRTLPAALDTEFRDPRAIRPTLRELSRWVRTRPDRRG